VNKVAGLLLAAGTSSRMGQPKQLLPMGGLGLLDRVLEQVLHSDLDLVTLVLGFKAREIRRGMRTDLGHPKLKVIQNTRYQEGISSSIIAGLSAVEDEYDHVMVILGDMPYVTSGLINLLLHRYLASHFPLGAIRIKEKRSHPAIIGRPFYPELHRLEGDMGARSLFEKHPDQVCLVEATESHEDMDIDTLEDYLKYKEALGDDPI